MWGPLLLGVGLGIPGSVIATYLYDILRTRMSTNRLSIEGSWGEYVKDAKGRQYSFGRIYFDKRRRFYAFDGTNFHDNGSTYCHWTTINSHVDREGRQFFYTFRTLVDDEPDRQYYGFGVVNLTLDEKSRLVPAGGYYVSASVDGKGMAHSMIRSDDLKYRRNMDGSVAIGLIKSASKFPSQT